MTNLAAFSPITKADLARARMFGLRLPAAPLADEAPAAVQPAGWTEIEADEVDPGDSWNTFDDASDLPWELGPAAEPIEAPAQASDDEAACGPADSWIHITPFVAVRASTVPDRTDSRPDAPRGLIELEGPRPSWDFGHVQTRWEQDQASRLFAPPARKPRYTGTGMTDADVAPRGVC